MSLTNGEKARSWWGQPIMFGDVCWVYPRTLRDIFSLDEDLKTFFGFLNLIIGTKPSFTKEVQDTEPELVRNISQLDNFSFVFFMAGKDEETRLSIAKAFEFFLGEKVLLLDDLRKIQVGPPAEKRLIDETNYFALRNLIQKLYWIQSDAEIEFLPTDDPMVTEMKKKVLLRRQILAKRKEQSGESDVSLYDYIASMVLKIPGVTPFTIWDLTYYSFYDLLRRYHLEERFKTYMQAAMAGAKVDKKELRHWIQSLDNKKEVNT